MTRSQACRILGVSIDADMQEIKKLNTITAYRKSMKLTRLCANPVTD